MSLSSNTDPKDIQKFCQSISETYTPLKPETEQLKDSKLDNAIATFAEVVFDKNLVGEKAFKVYKEKIKLLRHIEASLSFKKKIKLFFPFLRSKIESTFIEKAEEVKKHYKSTLEDSITKDTKKAQNYIKDSKISAKPLEMLSDALKTLAARINESQTLWERLLSKFDCLRSTVEKKLKAAQDEISKLMSPEGEKKVVKITKTDKAVREESAKLYSLDESERLAAYKTIGNEKLPDLPAAWSMGDNPWEDMHDSASSREVMHDIGEFIKSRDGRDRNKFLNVFSELSTYSRLVNSIGNIRGGSKSIEGVSNEIIKSIKNLTEGETCIVPGGYYNSQIKGGHTVIYEIRKQHGKYTFTLINTGEGLQKVFGLTDAFKKLFSSKMQDYQWEVSSLEEIINNEFWQKLISYNVGSEDASINDVYDTLGNLGTPKLTKFKHDIQVNGTCTYDSIICWLESYLDKPLFQEFELFMTDQGLNHLHKEKERLEKEVIASKNDPSKFVPLNLHLDHLQLVIDLGTFNRRRRNKGLPENLQKSLPEFPIRTTEEIEKLWLEDTLKDLQLILSNQTRSALRDYYYGPLDKRIKECKLILSKAKNSKDKERLQTLKNELDNEDKQVKDILDKTKPELNLRSDKVDKIIQDHAKSIKPRIKEIQEKLAKHK